MLNYRIFIVIALLLASAISIIAQDKVVTVNSATTWHNSPVDNERMNKRISDAAEQYKHYAPIPRIVLFDIGYPINPEEYAELNGYGILLVSSMSQDQMELPLSRVYAVHGAETIELTQIKEVRAKNINAESQVSKTFGGFRVDSLYLFPVYLRFEKIDLLIDFMKGRDGMKLASFDGTIPPNLKGLPRNEPSKVAPPDEKIKLFIKREYPGYSDKEIP